MNAASAIPAQSQPQPSSKGGGWWMVAAIMVLILLVMFVVLPLFIGCNSGCRGGRTIRGDLNILRLALESYQTQSSALPTTEQGLDALTKSPILAPILVRHEQVVEAVPHDPWGREYGYRMPASRSDQAYDLWSFGPDGLDGTADDIGNWNDE